MIYGIDKFKTHEMTTHERMMSMYEHKEADRIPVTDIPWFDTIKRWNREGMPEGINFSEYFNIDRINNIILDNSPRFKIETLEETEDEKIVTSSWGRTYRQFKKTTSTTQTIDFKIRNPDEWKKAKERMTPDRNRIPWEILKKNYKIWKEEGYWLKVTLVFGFDITHSWFIGTEKLLIALIEEPEWCMDMFDHCLNVSIALADMMLDAGYEFDCMHWWDDMGFKQNQFFSLKIYRELLKPYHKKAIEWAHSRNLKTELHSCGYIRPFIPDLVDIGLDSLNPLEVKSGMDPVEIKQKFGDKLVLTGGISAALWDNIEDIEKESRRLIPIMKENGGYVFSTDHSVPSNVSLEDFRRITALAKKLGKY